MKKKNMATKDDTQKLKNNHEEKKFHWRDNYDDFGNYMGHESSGEEADDEEADYDEK